MWILKEYADSRITDTRTNMKTDTGQIFNRQLGN